MKKQNSKALRKVALEMAYVLLEVRSCRLGQFLMFYQRLDCDDFNVEQCTIKYKYRYLYRTIARIENNISFGPDPPSLYLNDRNIELFTEVARLLKEYRIASDKGTQDHEMMVETMLRNIGLI